MTDSRPMSMRMAAAAGSLALAISAIAAPAVFAQDDDPQTAIDNLVAAIEAKDFEALPTFFCPDFAGAMGGFDMASITEGMPEGADVQSLFDAINLDVTVNSADVLSQTDTEAVLDLDGSMSMSVDAELLPPFITSLLESMGQEVTPDMVQMFTTMMMDEFVTETTDISTEVTLVRGEDGSWKICSDLGGSSATPDATADASPAVAEDMADASPEAMADASPEASDGE